MKKGNFVVIFCSKKLKKQGLILDTFFSSSYFLALAIAEVVFICAEKLKRGALSCLASEYLISFFKHSI